MDCICSQYSYRTLGVESLLKRGVESIEVGISEAPFQTAYFRSTIPSNEEALVTLERSKIKKAPVPCSSKD